MVFPELNTRLGGACYIRLTMRTKLLLRGELYADFSSVSRKLIDKLGVAVTTYCGGGGG